MGGLERGVAQQRDFAGAVIEHWAQALADFDVGGVHAHQRGVQVRPSSSSTTASSWGISSVNSGSVGTRETVKL